MTDLAINPNKTRFKDYSLLLVSVIWIVALLSAGAVAIYQQGFDWQFSPFIGAAIAPAVLGVLLHPLMHREWAQILVIFAWIALAIAATLAIAFVPMAFLFLCAPAAAALFEREKVIEAMVLSALAAGFVYYANRFGFSSTYQMPSAFEAWGRTTAPVATIVFMIGAMYAAASKGEAAKSQFAQSQSMQSESVQGLESGATLSSSPSTGNALKAFPGAAILVGQDNEILGLSDKLSERLGRDDDSAQDARDFARTLSDYGVSDSIITQTLAIMRESGQAQSFRTGRYVESDLELQEESAQDFISDDYISEDYISEEGADKEGVHKQHIKVDLVPATQQGQAYIYMTPVLNLNPASNSASSPAAISNLAGSGVLAAADNDGANIDAANEDDSSLFFAGISHELRTPLNAIIGFSDMMRARLFGPLPGKYAEYADLIHESGQYMLDLVGDVLDQSKINAGQYELSYEDFDMVDLARSCVKMMTPAGDEAKVNFRIEAEDDLPVMLRADRRALRQIILNLLSNAVKFSPAGSEVVLWLNSDLDAGQVQIHVRDQGQGMSEQELDKIGTPYAQGAAGKMSEARGSGLGLSLVKSLTQLHHGDFAVDSQLGQGTQIRITLPDAPAS